MTKMLDEELSAIQGYPDYAVSVDDESVWRVTRPLSSRFKNVQIPYRLKPSLNRYGYQIVCLYGANGKRRMRPVHQLVCEAFRGPCPPAKHEVAHFDGNPLNNRAENLRWATRKENAADSIRHGTHARGELHASAILTEAQVRQIRATPKERGDIAKIARELGQNYFTVYQADRGITWSWLK